MKTMNSNLLAFRQRGLFCDAVIIVKGVEFEVHKLIMSSASDVFHAKYTSETEEIRTTRVQIHDVEPVIFEEFLHYIYTKTSPKLNQFPIQLLKLAVKYAVQDLVELTESYLAEKVDFLNATDYLIAAHRLGRSKLKGRLFEFIRRNWGLTKTKGWKGVEDDFDLITELWLSFPEYPQRNYIVNGLKRDVVWQLLPEISDDGVESPIYKLSVDDDEVQFHFRFVKKLRSIDLIILNQPQKCGIPLFADYIISYSPREKVQLGKESIFWEKPCHIKKIVNVMRMNVNHRLIFTLRIDMKSKPPLLTPRNNSNSIVRQPLIFKDSDVTFTVNSQVFTGHRMFLASKSRFFVNLFRNPRSHYVLTEINAKCFGILLNYLYTKKIPGTDDMNLDLLQCADVFALPGLYKIIERYLTDYLRVEDAISGVIIAHKLGSKPIQSKAIDLIVRYMKYLSNFKNEWIQISQYPVVMKAILLYLREVEVYQLRDFLNFTSSRLLVLK